MDFAPYQDAPESTRALSPPPQPKSPPPPRSLSASPRPYQNQQKQPSNLNAAVRNEYQDVESGSGAVGGGGGWGFGGRREEVDAFETRLGIRMDFEACAAYLALPPAGAVFLLIAEHKSDYVRFHAWQSALLFTFLFVIHITFSWSPVISWLLFLCDLGLIAWLTLRAYRDADTLDRCQVPFFGPLASSILDDE